jgi:hypothetical protein
VTFGSSSVTVDDFEPPIVPVAKRDAEQQKYSEIAALVSVTVGRVQFGNAEPRFYTAWVRNGKPQCEQMFSAVIPTTDIRGVDGERVRLRQPNTIKPSEVTREATAHML